ncbi:unnamed protein product [Taenia asiatica]|uniref:Dehydrin n=1 Tax=Taenia asiatica TaxID=60517 RepID=A0A0R3WEH0_TAEAS|nr:unnamed protein product [Taenia asiatica]
MAEVEAKAPAAVTETDGAPETPASEEKVQEKPGDEEVKGEKPKKKHSVRSWMKKMTNFHGKHSCKSEKKEGKSEPMANGNEEKKEGAEPAAETVKDEDHKEEAEGQSQPHHEDKGEEKEKPE